MGKTKAENLTRLTETLTGPDIEALNNLTPGLGAKLHKIISNLGAIQGAQAGHAGTVVLAEQKKVDARGIAIPVMKLQGQRVAEGADAIDDQDYVTLKQVRSMLTCEGLAATLEDCLGDVFDLDKDKPSCAPKELTNQKQIVTGLDAHWGVEKQNELVYVLGEVGAVGHIQVYREQANQSFIQIGDLVLSEVFQRMVLQGRYLYLVRTITASSNLCSVDVGHPNAPDEVSSVGVGLVCKHIANQGRWMYVAGAGGVKLVDISVPGLPLVRGFAT